MKKTIRLLLVCIMMMAGVILFLKDGNNTLEAATDFEVTTCEGFINEFKDLSYVNKNVILKNDISCGGATISPLPALMSNIVVNGQGYTIKDFVINSSSGENVGFFLGMGINSKIQNIKFADFKVSGTGLYTGGVIAVSYGGIVENVSVNNGTVIGRENVGGILGGANLINDSITRVKDVNATNMIVQGNTRVGGAIGAVHGTAENVKTNSVEASGDFGTGGAIGMVMKTGTASNIIVDQADIKSNTEIFSYSNTNCGANAVNSNNKFGCNGGAIGAIESIPSNNLYGKAESVHVTNSKISGQYSIGGAVGWTGGFLSNVTVDAATFVDGKEQVGGATGGIEFAVVSDVVTSAKVSGELIVGGVAPSIKVDGKLINAIHKDGSITATGFNNRVEIGGVVGVLSGEVNNVYNSGEIISNADATAVGGVVGMMRTGATLLNAYNVGNISTPNSSRVGGVVGTIASTETINNLTNVYNLGNISAKEYVGGVIGSNDAGTNKIKNIFSLGEKINVSSNGKYFGAIIGSTKNDISGYSSAYKVDNILVNNNLSAPTKYEKSVTHIDLRNKSWWESINFANSNWSITNNQYPRLSFKTSEQTEKRVVDDSKIRIDGDTIFYLGENNVIKYAVTVSSRRTYYEYYPNTIYGSHGNKIIYVFKLNENFNLISAEKRNNNSRVITGYYEYYPNTNYRNHAKKIRYIINVDSNRNVTGGEQRANNTGRVINYYEYYPNSKYGTHGKHIRMIFHINANGHIHYSQQTENLTRAVQRVYEYYPNTQYGNNHGRRLKLRFDINKNNHIINSYLRNDNGGKEHTKYYYAANTEYGKHAGKVTRSEAI